jgi:hypothetical protein
MPVA